jgi:cytochrome c-type biogenesis protein
MNILYIGTAFIAGIISFLAPCVLPIIPGFLAYLAGSADASSTTKRRDIFINAVFFVLGFSTVFAVLGILLQTVLSAIGPEVQAWLSRIGGIVIIFFGLYLVGLIKIGFLETDHKVRVQKRFKSRFLTSFVFGMAFAVGWSPCAGAVLGGILALAVSSPLSSFFLLFAYALGLGVPFLIVGAFTGQAAALIEKIGNRKVFTYINIIFGIILICLGILVFTNDLTLIGNFDFINNLFLAK